jgi:hypothetical protein
VKTVGSCSDRTLNVCRSEWQTLKRLCRQNVIDLYDLGEFETDGNAFPVSTRALCQSHRSLCLTNHTFNSNTR